MKSLVLISVCLFVGSIDGAAYDWKTPEGCSCSCPVTYKGPYPPPSSLLHQQRDPWNPAVVKPGYPGYNPYDPYNPSYVNTWNRAGVVDPYVDPYHNPYYNKYPGQQWNRTWPYTGQWGASAWNRNQWGVQSSPWNPTWNSTWNRQPWNQQRWNQPWNNYNYPGYTGVNDLRAQVAVNSAGSGDSGASNGQTNEVQGASTTQSPYYYGNRQRDTETSASENYPQSQEQGTNQEEQGRDTFKRESERSEGSKDEKDEDGNVESRFGGSRHRTSGATYGSHNQGTSFNDRNDSSRRHGSGHGSSSSFGHGSSSGSGHGSSSSSSFGRGSDHHHSSSDRHDEGRGGRGHTRGGSSAGLGSGVGGGFGGNFGFGAGSHAGVGGHSGGGF